MTLGCAVTFARVLFYLHRTPMRSKIGLNLLTIAVTLSINCFATSAYVPVAVDADIELPPHIVRDTRPLPKPEKWFYAELPGIEILSSISQRNTKHFLEDFALFDQAIDVVWPGLKGKDLGVPTTMIMAGRGEFSHFMPPRERAAATQFGGSILYSTSNRRSIIVSMNQGRGSADSQLHGEERLSVLDESDGTSTAQPSNAAYVRRLRSSYVRLLLNQAELRLPPWMEEGISRLLQDMTVSNQHIQFARIRGLGISRGGGQGRGSAGVGWMGGNGAVTPRRDPGDMRVAGASGGATTSSEGGSSFRITANSELIPFAEMFAYTPTTKSNPTEHAIWANQSYAFVHMCLYGEGRRYKEPFLTFVDRLKHGEPLSEALFKECFKKNYKQMATLLRSYANDAPHQSTTWKAKKGQNKNVFDLGPLDVRLATQAEISRIKGEALSLAEKTSQARDTLFLAYRRGERTPQLLAAIGLHEVDYGDAERGEKFLYQATAQGVMRSEVYLKLAKLQLARAEQHDMVDGHLSAEGVKVISTLLRTAARHPLPSIETFELLAKTWELSATKPSPEDELILVAGAAEHPKNLRLAYRVARLCGNGTRLRDAHALADHGLQYAPDETTRKGFADLKAALAPL
jgi:hypothetical protein